MGGTSGVVGGKSLVKTLRSFLLRDLHYAVHNTLVWHFSSHWIRPLCHQSTFDQIEGHGKESGRESCRGRCSELSWYRRTFRHWISRQRCNDLFGLIVTRHHTDVHGHSSKDIRQKTSVQGADTFLPGGTNESLSVNLFYSMKCTTARDSQPYR